jgi:hypothetical protein
MKKTFLKAFIGGSLILAVSACSSSGANEEEVNTPEITLQELQQINKGMELDEVVGIIGGEGKQQGDNGKSGTKAHQVSYIWNGDTENSFVHINFLNNKVSTIKDVNMR